MTNTSDLNLAHMMAQAGFPASQIPVGIAIAHAESGLNPNATHVNTNGSTDYGLFQINSIHGSILQGGTWNNPQSNVNMAYQVWKNAGGKWTPWSTYNSGAYQRFLGASPTVVSSGTNASNAMYNPLGPLEQKVGSGFASATAGTLKKYASWIPANFQWRLFWMILGLILLLYGMFIIIRRPLLNEVLPVAKDAALAGA